VRKREQQHGYIQAVLSPFGYQIACFVVVVVTDFLFQDAYLHLVSGSDSLSLVF